MPADLRVQHLGTLSYLVSIGARHGYVPVTTTALGRAIGKSQQTASSHLAQLEAGGLVERRASRRGGSPVHITPHGYAELERAASALRGCLDSQPDHMRLEGTLVSGMGEGAYYMSLDGYTRQFRSATGYVPYPGTLNVRLDRPHHAMTAERLDAMDGVLINGFSDGRRTYGWVRCFAATVNDSIACHVIRLERTHHDPDIAEIISSVCIRDAGALDDGSRVSVQVQVQVPTAVPAPGAGRGSVGGRGRPVAAGRRPNVGG